ncbi:hypothetical protein HXX25_00110 [Hyphobacterium sp. CCMP332]|uniref:hypothetical protein n=1 Tax=Hyphobacterium sp. CCMP332 TaxID=2749086 RepID=UPI0016500C20|nr:hypothetical protein [Hyphobacterium sp. CCMP332]QNL17872.1 hypothetical protein HXX25_00110 [Hyphobacterium sp. CCMP332]
MATTPKTRQAASGIKGHSDQVNAIQEQLEKASLRAELAEAKQRLAEAQLAEMKARQDLELARKSM